MGKRFEVRIQGAEMQALRHEIQTLESQKGVTVEGEDALFAASPEILELVIHTTEAVKDHLIALTILEWLKGLKEKTRARSVDWKEVKTKENKEGKE